jgi:hypothetical protein
VNGTGPQVQLNARSVMWIMGEDNLLVARRAFVVSVANCYFGLSRSKTLSGANASEKARIVCTGGGEHSRVLFCKLLCMHIARSRYS